MFPLLHLVLYACLMQGNALRLGHSLNNAPLRPVQGFVILGMPNLKASLNVQIKIFLLKKLPQCPMGTF